MEETATVGPGPGMDVLSPGAVALERRAGVVERLRELDRASARADAARLRGLNDLRVEAEAVHAGSAAALENAVGVRARVGFGESSDLERRSVRAEAAAALRISERVAGTQLEFAKALCTELTATMDALTVGDISEYHARLIWEHACLVPADDRRVFEEQALVAARRLSTARLKGRLRGIQQRLHPEAAIERHRQAVDTRDVWVDPAADGMAILSALLPAATAVAAADRIEEYARGITGDPHETRTVLQVRADVFAEFVLGGEAGAWRITPTVQVVVPALSLLGHSEELAILDGYGPIDL
ncbi:DUF222 domain-containing protein, partial [Lysobacter korlensis]